jgi:hypothetical protein
MLIDFSPDEEVLSIAALGENFPVSHRLDGAKCGLYSQNKDAAFGWNSHKLIIDTLSFTI